jgi:Winged helix-turn helix
VSRDDAEGASGLGDQRARNTGARPLPSQEDEAALRDALAEPPSDGGLWNGPKVAAWVTARLGRKIWPQRGWDYLHRLGSSSQVPRPRHVKAASAEEQEALKRKRSKDPMRVDGGPIA